MKVTSNDIQEGVLVSFGLEKRYTTVNFNNVEVEDGYEYNTAEFQTDRPFTKENFDVVKDVIDAVLADGDTIPVSAVGEVADLFNVGKTSNEVVEAARKVLIDNITKYDVSDNVNGFYVNGQLMWLDKNMRTSLMNTVTIEKNAGMTTTTFWWDAVSYTFPIELFEYMLSTLELYAKACYNKTQEHIADGLQLTTYSALVAYDYTDGYPEMLSFNTNG